MRRAIVVAAVAALSVLLNVVCAPTPPAPVWTRTLTSDASLGEMTDVVFANNHFVAVGALNVGGGLGVLPNPVATAWTSSDGVTWGAAPRDASVFEDGSSIGAVRFASSNFIAVGTHVMNLSSSEGMVWGSTDGATWRVVARIKQSPYTFITLADVAVDGQNYWATGIGLVGGSGYALVASSTDGGASWSVTTLVRGLAQAVAVTNSQIVNAGGPRLVAVGAHDTSACPNGDNAIWTSADGRNWTLQPFDPDPGCGALRDVMVHGGVIYTGGHDGSPPSTTSKGMLWSSPDGSAWTRYTDAHPENAPAFGNPHTIIAIRDAGGALGWAYIAVGYDDAHDGDGVVWFAGSGNPVWRPLTSALFVVAGRQRLNGSAGGSDAIVVAGSDLGHAAIWTYRRP